MMQPRSPACKETKLNVTMTLYIVLQHCCTRNLKNILIPDAPFSIQMFICFNFLLYSFSAFLIFFSSTVLLLLYPIWHSTYLSLALLLFLLYIFFACSYLHLFLFLSSILCPPPSPLRPFPFPLLLL